MQKQRSFLKNDILEHICINENKYFTFDFDAVHWNQLLAHVEDFQS